jgi:glutaredoxin
MSRTARGRVLTRLLLTALLTAAALGWAMTGMATPASAVTDTDVERPAADIVYFWGEGCPNCANATAYLDEVALDHPDLVVERLEIWNDADNRDVFEQTAGELGFEATSVPTIVIDERVWIGWTSAVERDIDGAIDTVLRGDSPRPGVFGSAAAGTCSDVTGVCTSATGTVVDVPLVGEVGLEGQSLLVSTVLIGFVDGINPCSLWVITILLVIVIRSGSRRRVMAIGSRFLLVTAAMYALYMAAMYSALAVVGYLGAIQIVVGAAALVFGAVSVKDYFALKKGLSFTIRDSDKPGIFQRARKAAGQQALIPALIATVGLAVAVSLLEAPCTAGFPLLWTGMLHANDVGAAQTAALWLAYMVPYLLDEMAIFTVAIVTMRATHMQEKHGELLKLIAGVTMLMLAVVMFTDPTLMEDPWVALALFGAAFVLAALVHVVSQQVRATRASRAQVEQDARKFDA